MSIGARVGARSTLATLCLVLSSCVAVPVSIPYGSATGPRAVTTQTTTSSAPPGSACLRRDSVKSLTTATESAAPPPSAFPAVPPPGRLMFTKGSAVTFYEAGRISSVDMGGPPIGYRGVHSTTDGSLLSALVNDGAVVGVWMYEPSTGAVTRKKSTEPIPATGANVIWSTDGLHAAYDPDPERPVTTTIYIIDRSGRTETVNFGPSGTYVYGMDWRTDTELTLLVGSAPTYPLYGARLMSWTLGIGAGQLVQNIRSATADFAWSPGGAALVYGDSDVPGGPPRLLRRDAQGSTTVLLAADALRALPNGCDLSGTMLFYRLRWSPDGSRVAILGRQEPQCCYFLAIGRADGGEPKLFRSPESCYFNGELEWLDADRLIAEMTGPECGRTNLEGRAVLIDGRTAEAIGEVPVGRKSELHVSPDRRWVLSSGSGGFDLIPLAEPVRRVFVPIPGAYVGWCCE